MVAFKRNMAKNVMGVDNDPLYYSIMPDQPAGWVPPNAFAQQMYQLTHTRAVYNSDKKMVWGNILKASLNTPSWEWIKEFESTEYYRAAWQFLVEKYKRQDATNKKVLLTTGVVSLNPNYGGTLYNNEYQLPL